MRELFIYYRSNVVHAEAVAAAVRTMQSDLSRRVPGLRARLLRRPGTDEQGRHTWMETYSTDPMHASDGISPELQQDIADAAAALAPWIDGPRHIEIFESCAS